MDFANSFKNNLKLFLAISLILALLVSTSFISNNQNILTNDKSSSKDFDIQFQSNPNPRKAEVFYEDTTGTAMGVYVIGD